MPFVESSGIRFHYTLSGSRGPLVVFQHGLGGEVSQPQGILGDSGILRAFSFDCRGHGRTKPMGPPESLRFSVFADDLRSVLDTLRIDSVIAGGISMGAGVALNFALRYPSRAKALIISRPAWLDTPCPPNLEILRMMAHWLREYGAEKSRKLLLSDPEFVRIQRVSRNSAASILGQLERPNRDGAIATLAQLPADTPCPAHEAWRDLSIPTLVLINTPDPMHPAEYGQRLAAEIPCSHLVQITSKEMDPVLHAHEAREAIEGFVSALEDR
jgi:pimeloyl-ACP methyl ester carboxylesterase